MIVSHRTLRNSVDELRQGLVTAWRDLEQHIIDITIDQWQWQAAILNTACRVSTDLESPGKSGKFVDGKGLCIVRVAW